MVLKYSLLPARVRLLDSPRDYAGNRRFQFHKRHHLFLCAHDESFSVTMRVSNPDRSASLAYTDRESFLIAEAAMIPPR
jgi:hypothetical protein